MSLHLRICLAVGAALAVARAEAAELTTEGTSSPRESPRALNGHVFQPSRLVPGPFSDTAFGMVTFFGIGQAEAPRYDLQGNQIGTRDYTMAAYGQGFNLDLRVTPDIGFRLDLSGLLFSGINGQGILVAGATAQYGFTTGVVAGRDLNRTMRLSFVFDVGLQPQLSVLVGNAILRAIQTQTFEDTGLFSKVNRTQAAPGISFAWAPSPALGFVAETRYLWTRRVTGEEDTSRTAQGLTLGGVAAVDLDPLIRWPIAVQGAYRADVPVGGNGIAHVQQASLGVYYTRRVRLALGLETIWRHGEIRPGVQPTLKSDSATGALQFRYYW